MHRTRLLAAAIAIGLPFMALAEDAPPEGNPAAAPAPPAWTFNGAMAVAPGVNVLWELDEQFAPTADYNDNRTWGEAYAELRWQGAHTFGGGTSVYGAASVLGTYTVGKDVFDAGPGGRIAIEEAFIGLRGGNAVKWDVSVGSQDFRIGHGLLIATGGGNGFERGALALAPHRAWEVAGVAKLEGARWSAQAFYLDPDELKSSDTHTRLVGARVGGTPASWLSGGLSYLYAPRSEAIYPILPVGILENARDGLKTWNLDFTAGVQTPGAPGFTLRGELAVQRNSRIDLRSRGGILDAAYQFGDVRWSPKVSYSPRWFDGDKPGSPDYERFDPLFYDGSPATWSSGASGSFAFYNSNLWVQRWRVDLMPSQRDFININYYDVRAARADSPIQYGQAARLEFNNGVPVLATGVPDRRLTHEFYFEHTRVLGPHWFLTWSLAVSKPRAGLQAIAPDAKTWYGGLVNLTWSY